MKSLPLSPQRLPEPDMSAPSALADNVGAILDRAAALAELLEQVDPASDSIMHDGRHPFTETARALWLEIQDAKTYLAAHLAQGAKLKEVA